MEATTHGAKIDTALFRLRRIWSRSFRTRRPNGSHPAVHMSNVLVVHAIVRLSADCAEVTVGAVAENLGIDPSTASRFVNDAICAGLVERRASEVDARRVRLLLTDRGRRVLDVVTGYRRDYIDGLVSDWSERDRETLARLLTRLADATSRTPSDLSGLDSLVAAAIKDGRG